MVAGQATTRNQHFGLMKGHMPLPVDDIARGDKVTPLLKPSDQATFVEHAPWPKINFDKMVHPFSNSISGTMLCQLRSIAQLRNNGTSSLTASRHNMEQYVKLFISARLFGTGGHTLEEFTAPLSLKQTKDEFKTTPEFKKIKMQSMFLKGNEVSFDSALKDTIAYNAMVLQRQQLNSQIKGETPVKPTNSALKNLKLQHELHSRNSRISKILESKDNYAKEISSQFFSSWRTGVKKNEMIQV